MRSIPRSVVGYVGLAWAVSFIPIHVYWALGGLIRSIGVDKPLQPAANWGACVLIAGAGLVCLTLTQPWGAVVPRGLSHGVAWIGGGFAVLHWAVFSTMCALRLAGVIGLPGGDGLTPSQAHNYDWANLYYFEPWFAVMGLLLIACAVRDRRPASVVAGASAGTHARKAGTAITLAGLLAVLWGVFTFTPWIFAGLGPALMGAGLLTLVATARREAARHTATQQTITARSKELIR